MTNVAECPISRLLQTMDFYNAEYMARKSNVNLYVLMWSPRQQYVFVSVLFISINILHASSLFYLLT